MTKEGYDINSMNDKWLKFCLLMSSLELLNFYGNNIFFCFNDIVKIVSIFWFYRENKIEANDLFENFEIFGTL